MWKEKVSKMAKTVKHVFTQRFLTHSFNQSWIKKFQKAELKFALQVIDLHSIDIVLAITSNL